MSIKTYISNKDISKANPHLLSFNDIGTHFECIFYSCDCISFVHRIQKALSIRKPVRPDNCRRQILCDVVPPINLHRPSDCELSGDIESFRNGKRSQSNPTFCRGKLCQRASTYLPTYLPTEGSW